MKKLLTLLLLSAHISGTAAEMAAEPGLTQCAEAPVQALRFIEVATASLWRDNCNNSTAALSAPLLLEFTYHRKVPGDAFNRSANAMFERNVTDSTLVTLKKRVQAFNSHYRDTVDGDLYQLRYLNDGTLELLLNNKLLAREKGHDFAQAYLQIWFGPKPYSERLKQQLLASQ